MSCKIVDVVGPRRVRPVCADVLEPHGCPLHDCLLLAGNLHLPHPAIQRPGDRTMLHAQQHALEHRTLVAGRLHLLVPLIKGRRQTHLLPVPDHSRSGTSHTLLLAPVVYPGRPSGPYSLTSHAHGQGLHLLENGFASAGVSMPKLPPLHRDRGALAAHLDRHGAQNAQSSLTLHPMTPARDQLKMLHLERSFAQDAPFVLVLCVQVAPPLKHRPSPCLSPAPPHFADNCLVSPPIVCLHPPGVHCCDEAPVEQLGGNCAELAGLPCMLTPRCQDCSRVPEKQLARGLLQQQTAASRAACRVKPRGKGDDQAPAHQTRYCLADSFILKFRNPARLKHCAPPLD